MNAPFNSTDAATASEVPVKKSFAVPRSALVMGLIALAVAIAGIVWLTAPRSSESTDNAYLHGQAADMLARDQLGEIFRLLLRAGPTAQLVDAEVRMRAIRKAD